MCEESCKKIKIVAVTFLYGVRRAKTHLSYVEFNSLSFGRDFSSIGPIVKNRGGGGVILHLAARGLRLRTEGVKQFFAQRYDDDIWHHKAGFFYIHSENSVYRPNAMYFLNG